ncbi:MAG: preprotein translocase subunit SecE [Bacteroidetes bacterium]|nr:preprotein translocase subunit SecE [Bacteroidota bacterium]
MSLYIRESYNELVNKVTWPTWSELLSSTRVVLVASVIIALLIFLMDLVSKQVLTFIYDLSN